MKDIYKFWIRSRAEVEADNPCETDHVIISINTPGSDAAKVVTNDHTLYVQPLWFDDFDELPGPAFRRVYGREPELFTKEQAQSIWKTLSEEMQIAKGAGEPFSTIVVHCDAGISRSAGVGAALAKHLNGSDVDFFQSAKVYGSLYLPGTFAPNMHVRRVLLEVLTEGVDQ